MTTNLEEMPRRVSVIGSEVSDCDADVALRLIDCVRISGRGGYVCFTNAHTAVEGRRDIPFRRITNESTLSLADGKPVYWAARSMGAANVGHVPGPDFFRAAMHRYPERGHFLYGSTEATLVKLRDTLLLAIPNLRICGYRSPPFREMSIAERLEHYAEIRESGAAFVWVGLGAPKQERWMSQAWQHIRPCLALGVGAAFDFESGIVPRAPPRLGRLGLEWSYRLYREPRRLWKRYLTTNTLFVYYVIRDALSST